jgi:hypothetical protein
LIQRCAAINPSDVGNVAGHFKIFYHKSSRLFGVGSFGLKSHQTAEIEDERRIGFENGALRPPPIETVPFDRDLDAYSRVAARQAKTKQALSFD